MLYRYRGFFIGIFVAFVFQIAAILVFRLAFPGMNCPATRESFCSIEFALRDAANIVSDINILTLGAPTILLAGVFVAIVRIAKELFASGASITDFLSR